MDAQTSGASVRVWDEVGAAAGLELVTSANGASEGCTRVVGWSRLVSIRFQVPQLPNNMRVARAQLRADVRRCEEGTGKHTEPAWRLAVPVGSARRGSTNL